MHATRSACPEGTIDLVETTAGASLGNPTCIMVDDDVHSRVSA